MGLPYVTANQVERKFEEQKSELGDLIKDYLIKHPEVLDEALESRSMQEVFDSYPVADGILDISGERAELTPEIKAFIDKCMKVQKIQIRNNFVILNFIKRDSGTGAIKDLCFGCINNEDYSVHIEISINNQENNYYVAFSEL